MQGPVLDREMNAMTEKIRSFFSEDARRMMRRPFFKLFNLRRFKNIHAGREAFLIGNGPSARPEVLNRLQRHVTFCFNRFHLAYEKFDLQLEPDYTVSIDPQIIQDFGRELIERSHGQLLLGTCRWMFTSGQYDCFPIRYTQPFVFGEDLEDFISTGDSVLVASIQIGYYMGIRRFYLYGVDHNFNIQQLLPDGRALGDGNHFIPNYRSDRPWIPPRTRQIEQALTTCNEFLTARGGALINCTDGGNLELLPRQNIEEVLRPAFASQPARLPGTRDPAASLSSAASLRCDPFLTLPSRPQR